MSTPIEEPESSDPPEEYVPPWARGRVRPGMPVADRVRDRSLAGANVISGGDRGVLKLRDQLALEPDQLPEPPRQDVKGLWLIALQMCAVCGIAALIAWAMVSLLAPKRTGQETARNEAPPRQIASAGTGLVQSQPQKVPPPPQVQDGAAGTNAPGPGDAVVPEPATAPSQAEPLSPSDSPSNKPLQRPETVARAPSAKDHSPGSGDAVVPVPATAPSQAEPHAVLPTNNPPSQTEIASAAPQRSVASEPVDKTIVLGTDEIAALVKRGKDFIATGDFASARLLLRRAAAAGSAEAALALGATFDPFVIRKLGAIGIQPDVDQAREWYQRAAALGSAAASRQLANLAGAQ